MAHVQGRVEDALAGEEGEHRGEREREPLPAPSDGDEEDQGAREKGSGRRRRMAWAVEWIRSAWRRLSLRHRMHGAAHG